MSQMTSSGLSDLAAKLTSLRGSLEQKVAIRDSLVKRVENSRQLATEAEYMVSVCDQAMQFLAQFADERQEQVLHTIEAIASVGLSQIFNEPMELKIEQVTRARRVEMDIRVKTGTLETPILEARGGGLAAVAGFLLRASIVLLTPQARKILILDEVFAMLSEDYVPRVAEFLHELCEKTGLQIILVTHQEEFAEAADKVLKIEKIAPNTSRLVEIDK